MGVRMGMGMRGTYRRYRHLPEKEKRRRRRKRRRDVHGHRREKATILHPTKNTRNQKKERSPSPNDRLSSPIAVDQIPHPNSRCSRPYRPPPLPAAPLSPVHPPDHNHHYASFTPPQTSLVPPTTAGTTSGTSIAASERSKRSLEKAQFRSNVEALGM